MHLPPLQSPSMTHSCISGDVSIAPDAVIAAGSVLKADSDSAIVIGSGVCLGLGSVLHANGGKITVEMGASIGSGSLIVGHCHIGSQACIGASTTIYNVSVAPSQLVPAGSLLGSIGRSVDTASSASAAQPKEAEVAKTTEKRNSAEAPSPKAARMDPEPSPWDEVDPEPPAASSSPNSAPAIKTPRSKTVVYGKAQFEQMRSEMFSRGEDI